MNTHANKSKQNRSPVTSNHAAGGRAGNKSALQLQDNRARSTIQKRQVEAMAEGTPVQRKNSTGLPDELKSGIEGLSGQSMDDVKVHFNSDKPARLNAHAYAQGADIHIASGQERHLPHEAWHVVQQKQGRVKPTMQMKGKVNINDEKGLENEADLMGEKAMQGQAQKACITQGPNWPVSAIQRKITNAGPENQSQYAALTAAQKLIFDQIEHDGALELPFAEAIALAKNKENQPKDPSKNKDLMRIEDPEGFIGLYSILYHKQAVNWPPRYHKCLDLIEEWETYIDDEKNEDEKVGYTHQITIQNEGLIKGYSHELESHYDNAKKLTLGLRESLIKGDGNHTYNEERLGDITTKIGALSRRMADDPKPQDRSALGRAREGEPGYHLPVIEGFGLKHDYSKDTNGTKPSPGPDKKSVYTIPQYGNILMLDNTKLNQPQVKENLDTVKKAIDESAPKGNKKTYYGAAARADRGAGQINKMNGYNAATYALASGLIKNGNNTDWEWLHIQGAGLGGETMPSNLLPGTKDANTLMMPYENNLKALAGKASKKDVLTVVFSPEERRGATHVCNKIKFDWRFKTYSYKTGRDFEQNGAVEFDILNARATTKGDIEKLEGFLAEQRKAVIHPEDAAVAMAAPPPHLGSPVLGGGLLYRAPALGSSGAERKGNITAMRAPEKPDRAKRDRSPKEQRPANTNKAGQELNELPSEQSGKAKEPKNDE